jgi:ribosome-associated protein
MIEEQEPPAPISKSQRKRDMHDLQDIGEELVALSADRLRALELPEPLLDAVQAARNISKFGALRRQLQYVGRLMRSVDSEPIRAQLDAWNGKSAAHTAWLHRLENWRERLLAEEDALGEFMTAFPAVDTQHLRTLIRNARQERLEDRPPKAFRALFQTLRDTVPPPEAG